MGLRQRVWVVTMFKKEGGPFYPITAYVQEAQKIWGAAVSAHAKLSHSPHSVCSLRPPISFLETEPGWETKIQETNVPLMEGDRCDRGFMDSDFVIDFHEDIFTWSGDDPAQAINWDAPNVYHWAKSKESMSYVYGSVGTLLPRVRDCPSQWVATERLLKTRFSILIMFMIWCDISWFNIRSIPCFWSSLRLPFRNEVSMIWKSPGWAEIVIVKRLCLVLYA
jgi:hypothetical protein